jgi:GWxTD domain-containing protein
MRRLALLLLPSLLAAQQPPPAAYDSALARLAAADTAAAIAQLRRAIRVAPRYGPAYLRLGSILSERSTSAYGFQPQRAEAERLLHRAVQLMDGDPVAMLEVGLLLRKQGVSTDARRVVERAERAAQRRGVELPPELRARLHYRLALMYERFWEDVDHLIAYLPLGPFGCARNYGQAQGDAATVFAIMASACPEDVHEALRQTAFIADETAAEYGLMLDHFYAALRADTAHTDAALHLLGHQAQRGDWLAFDALVAHMLTVRPDDARVLLFVALGLHERGLVSRADSVFRRAIALLPQAERAVFEDVGLLLPRSVQAHYAALDSTAQRETARRFFAGSDPLLLSAVEERRLEHWARLAWAELKFASPESRLRGWDTERGQTWLRYGRPEVTFQCCFAGLYRTEFWSYGSRGPVFSFRRLRTSRYARHTDASHILANQELAELGPQHYRPRTVATYYRYPHQVVRLRGSRSDLTRFEIHATPPLDSLWLGAEGLAAGIFVRDLDHQPLWEQRRTFTGDDARAQSYAFEVGPGTLQLSIEARAEAPEGQQRPVAMWRDTVTTLDTASGRLALSDLLLADTIAPRVPSPARRADVVVVPSRTLAFPPGHAVHLYFEVYGTTVGADSLASYDVEVTVTDSTGGGLLGAVVRGFVRLIGIGPDETRVRWERAWRPTGDRAVEYLALELARADEGTYVVAVTVRDRITGQVATSVRPFRVVTARR